jgi:hypothetical protein
VRFMRGSSGAQTDPVPANWLELDPATDLGGRRWELNASLEGIDVGIEYRVTYRYFRRAERELYV